MGFLKKFTKQEISWMMYDWANSAHSVIVVTILPIFFDTVAGYTADSVSSMSTWGFATSLAMAIVALSAPVPGRVRRHPRYAQKAVHGIYAHRCCLGSRAFLHAVHGLHRLAGSGGQGSRR